MRLLTLPSSYRDRSLRHDSVARDYVRVASRREEMGIPEYWIVDYLGLGGRRFIGNPKQPTFSIYQLVEGEYQVSQFRGDNRIESPTFPELNLTAQQVFSAGEWLDTIPPKWCSYYVILIRWQIPVGWNLSTGWATSSCPRLYLELMDGELF